MMDFIGRKNELASLDERYKTRRSQLVVMYGRRRVGKSTLLRRFSKAKKALLHVGDRSTQELQIKKILNSAADLFNEPLLRQVSIRTWQELFEILSPHLAKQKTILSFDEFQWTCESSPELPSILQRLWDEEWEKSGNMFLILCGSYMGFMEREVLGKKSPLFGRRTAQIQLKPFSFLEAREFHPGYNEENAARTYAVCGGIPAYLLAFQDGRSVDENIIKECLADAGRLREEPRFLTMEELREPVIYYSILESLHVHRLGITELARRLSADKGNLIYYLNTLLKLGYLEKLSPLGTPLSSSRGRYVIQDALLRFWFSLVYPFMNDLTLKPAKDVFLGKVKPRLESFFGAQFERLCRDAVPFILANDKVTASFKVGAYWDKRLQIDLVVEREDGVTHIAECKWLERPAGKEVLTELERKCREYPNPHNHTLVPMIFSRSGFTEAVLREKKVRTYTLKGLYGACADN